MKFLNAKRELTAKENPSAIGRRLAVDLAPFRLEFVQFHHLKPGDPHPDIRLFLFCCHICLLLRIVCCI